MDASDGSASECDSSRPSTASQAVEATDVKALSSAAFSGTGGAAASSHGTAGGLHPELRARLERMGIGLAGDAKRQNSSSSLLPAGVGSSNLAGFSRSAGMSAEKCPNANRGEGIAGGAGAKGASTRRPPAMPGGGSAAAVAAIAASMDVDGEDRGVGKEDSVDDLLLQLDDLDARSKALQKDAAGQAAETEAQKAARRAGRKADKAARAAAAEASPRQQQDSEGDEPVSKDSMAETIAKQHPLKGLRLGESGGCRGEFRRSSRPPVVPGTPSASNRTPRKNTSMSMGSTAATATSNATLPYPASPSSARGTRGEKGSSVKLPDLKASASAPGCLMTTGSLFRGGRAR